LIILKETEIYTHSIFSNFKSEETRICGPIAKNHLPQAIIAGDNKTIYINCLTGPISVVSYKPDFTGSIIDNSHEEWEMKEASVMSRLLQYAVSSSDPSRGITGLLTLPSPQFTNTLPRYVVGICADNKVRVFSADKGRLLGALDVDLRSYVSNQTLLQYSGSKGKEKLDQPIFAYCFISDLPRNQISIRKSNAKFNVFSNSDLLGKRS
jgi:hypothetical protein